MCSAFRKRVHVVIGIADNHRAAYTEMSSGSTPSVAQSFRNRTVSHAADSFALLAFQHGGERRKSAKGASKYNRHVPLHAVTRAAVPLLAVTMAKCFATTLALSNSRSILRRPFCPGLLFCSAESAKNARMATYRRPRLCARTRSVLLCFYGFLHPEYRTR